MHSCRRRRERKDRNRTFSLDHRHNMLTQASFPRGRQLNEVMWWPSAQQWEDEARKRKEKKKKYSTWGPQWSTQKQNSVMKKKKKKTDKLARLLKESRA